MQIDLNEQFEKHESSIRISRDSISNVSNSIFDSEKQSSPRISISFQIETRPDFPKYQTRRFSRLSTIKYRSIKKQRFFASTVIDRHLQPMNADPAMNSTFPGMQIDLNEHFLKHESSIRISRHSFSNVTDSSFEKEKHDFPRISTFRRMQIDLNEQHTKHESSIRVKRDSFSNVTDSSFESAKHHFGRISTTMRGTQMRVS
jgi:hypothetical protein